MAQDTASEGMVDASAAPAGPSVRAEVPAGGVPGPGRAESPAQMLLAMTLGAAQTQVLRAAGELDIADLLRDGPRPAADLARATGADPDALLRLLRALTLLGVTHEVAPETFATTDVGALLRSDAPDTLRQYAILMGQGCFGAAWPGLADSIRTGRSSFGEVHGQGVYDYFRTHPSVGAVMNQAMTDLSRQEGLAIRDAYHLGSRRSVVDVGGGRGALLAALLQAYPKARGTLYDLPHVVAEAGPVLSGHGVADRSRVLGGDFMTEVPAGGDLYVLKRILIDLTDDAAVTVLRNVRAAIGPDGRLLVADPDVRSSYGSRLDMFMLMVFGAKLRTEAELAALLGRTGFRLTRGFETDSAIRLIEAAPV